MKTVEELKADIAEAKAAIARAKLADKRAKARDRMIAWSARNDDILTASERLLAEKLGNSLLPDQLTLMDAKP